MREEFAAPLSSDESESCSACSESGQQGGSEDQELDELEQLRVITEFATEQVTLFVIDYAPGLVFRDRVAETISALVKVAEHPVSVMELPFEVYDEEWKERLGSVHLFPTYLLSTSKGVFNLHGSFLRKMYIIKKLLSV